MLQSLVYSCQRRFPAFSRAERLMTQIDTLELRLSWKGPSTQLLNQQRTQIHPWYPIEGYAVCDLWASFPLWCWSIQGCQQMLRHVETMLSLWYLMLTLGMLRQKVQWRRQVSTFWWCAVPNDPWAKKTCSFRPFSRRTHGTSKGQERLCCGTHCEVRQFRWRLCSRRQVICSRGLDLRVIFWARKIIWMFFSFMISIWFCYGFVMVSIWWKIWSCYGFKVLYQRDMIFNMIFVWCETASAKQNCECQSTQMWNKQTPICSFEKKMYTLFKVKTRQK